MKFFLFSLSLWLFFFNPQNPQILSGQAACMTFNLRFDNSADGINDWNHRRDAVINLIEKYKPDILGTQEGLFHQLEFMENNLLDYAYFGQSRDDGKIKGEFSAIFYPKSRWELLHTETFWLSESGEVGSTGWDAALPRVVTFGSLKSKTTGDTLYVFNAHFDHVGEIARLKSSEYIMNVIEDKSLQHKKVVVMGDFNATPDEAPVQVFEAFFGQKWWQNIDPQGMKTTFTGFRHEGYPMKIIDHIFTLGLVLKSCKIIEDKREDGEFISDHFPVFIQVE